MKRFLYQNEIVYRHSPPYHHSSNGQAQWTVQIHPSTPSTPRLGVTDTCDKQRRHFPEEGIILLRNYGSGPKWILGMVIIREGPVKYKDKTTEGQQSSGCQNYLEKVSLRLQGIVSAVAVSAVDVASSLDAIVSAENMTLSQDTDPTPLAVPGDHHKRSTLAPKQIDIHLSRDKTKEIS
ncbi:hypothetical protein PR048_030097 [Dryococelus australis]|uniref:Uncharacterized protein n=1 Tax=Dryococelus australis TaxID=614101 RepID=A0ABQ9GBV4_9NEOP|nr:hypothetical protein PR048_030097 [Dryococelus australis]